MVGQMEQIQKFTLDGKRVPFDNTLGVRHFPQSVDGQLWAGISADGILLSQVGKPTKWIPGVDGWLGCFSWDGTRLFIATRSNKLKLYEIQELLTKEAPKGEVLLEGDSFKGIIRIPGSDHVITFGNRGVSRIDPNAPEPVWHLQLPGAVGAIVPVGSKTLQLTYQIPSKPMQTYKFDLDSGTFIEATPSDLPLGDQIYSPDGTRFAMNLREGRLGVYNSSGDQIAKLIAGGSPSARRYINTSNCIAWSPEGRYLAVVVNDNGSGRQQLYELTVWDLGEVDSKK